VTTASASPATAPPSDNPAPSTPRIYRPELDVLRFFAFFCVYLHHTLNPGTTGGLARHFPLVAPWYPVIQQSLGLGLCLFFFLSSYLITSLLRIERARTGTVNLKKFYLRRILRIWPLYLTYLLAISVVGIWWRPIHVEPLRLAALLLLAGNWYAIFAGPGAASILHLWSISVEEQFYLLWPRISRGVSTRALGIVCIAISLVSLSAIWALFATGSSSLNVWYNSLAQSLFFSTGALFALAIGMHAHKPSILRATLFIAAGLALWVCAERLGGLTDHLSPARAPWAATSGYALAALGCALLLWGFLHLPSYLLAAPLIYLGRISYGLYVFHLLFVLCTRGVWSNSFHILGSAQLASLLFTLAAAALSYQLLEKPFLKLKSRFELVPTRAA
jgi:peptidoglycan/LPS O-acetylase OafA/YrhL